jgi:hypothetical protein
MRKIIRLAGVASGLLALATAACSSDDGMSSGSGQLSVVLKDAPGDIKAAVVTISEINLQGSGGKLVLSNNEVTTDLLTLSTDVETLVQDATVPARNYTQLRFVITGGYVEVDNGNGTSSIYASDPNYAGLPPGATVTGNLQMPSLGQSGLKVTLPGNKLTISSGDQKLLVVDFDVSQSFGHLAGGSGQWVMHPVIKADEVSATGGARVAVTLEAGVTLPGTAVLSEFSVTLTGSDGIPRTALLDDSDGDGTFEAVYDFLAPGGYDVTIQAPAGVTAFTTTPALPGTLTVQGGQTATASFTITSAI